MAAGAIWPLPRLRLSRRLRAPVCFGLRRPAVLLPEPMDDAGDAQLRRVFAHELTHLRRRDPWSSWGLGLAQAVYFFLPWFWWIRRSVRLCQEYVADAAAAKAGAAADEYAEFLVSLARGRRRRWGRPAWGVHPTCYGEYKCCCNLRREFRGAGPEAGRCWRPAGCWPSRFSPEASGLRGSRPTTKRSRRNRKT